MVYERAKPRVRDRDADFPCVGASLWRTFLGVGTSGEAVSAVGRSRGFTSVLIQMQRQAERDARARAAAQRRAQVEANRARRAYERAAAADQKEQARLYTESRVAEVAALKLSTKTWLRISPLWMGSFTTR